MAIQSSWRADAQSLQLGFIIPTDVFVLQNWLLFKRAFFKFAPVKFVSFKVAPRRFALRKSAPRRSDSVRLAVLKSALRKLASLKLAPLKFERLKSAPRKFAPLCAALNSVISRRGSGVWVNHCQVTYSTIAGSLWIKPQSYWHCFKLL